MELCSYKQMRPLLERHGFHFSKAKGQNFLIASWVPERIAEECGADEHCGVVEIGPGVGCLTEQLSMRAGKVLAYEVDERLRPVLAETLGHRDNIQILFGDAMGRDMAADAAEFLPGLKPMLCANLPYNITTPVLTKAYEARCFSSLTVMIQKEVAERICAAPGTEAYGAFSVFSQWYTEPKMLFTVAPGCFMPPPKVTSAVIHMKTRDLAPAEVDETAFFRVVRAAFGQRRKTLANSLSGLCGKEMAQEAIRACGLDERVRGEALGIPEFAALTNILETMK